MQLCFSVMVDMVTHWNEAVVRRDWKIAYQHAVQLRGGIWMSIGRETDQKNGHEQQQKMIVNSLTSIDFCTLPWTWSIPIDARCIRSGAAC